MNADAEYTEQEVADAVAGFTIRRIIGCDIISVLSDGQLAWADSLSNTEREAFLESKRNKLLVLDEMGAPRLYLAEYPMYGRNEVAREGEDLDFRAADVRRLTEVERGGYEARPDAENVESQNAEDAGNKPSRRTSKGNSRMIGLSLSVLVINAVLFAVSDIAGGLFFIFFGFWFSLKMVYDIMNLVSGGKLGDI